MSTFSNTGAEGQGVEAGSAKGNKWRGREREQRKFVREEREE